MSEAKHNSIQDYTEYLPKGQYTKIMSHDNHLTDEFSFDLFNKTNSYIPVVLINSNDNEMTISIEIESQKNLSKSENNDRELKILKADILQPSLKNLFPQKQTQNFIISGKRKKTRLLVKRGVAHIALQVRDIALIYTKNKLAYVIDSDSKKYSIDKTLTELEEELDSYIFFRANRQYIVNINFIKSFKAYHRVKLVVEMNIPELEEPVIISQQTAPVFKKWMNDA